MRKRLTLKRMLSLADNILKLGDLKGVKFCYAISKNLKILRGEIEDLNNCKVSNERFDQFDKQRKKLCVFYSNKDENQNPVISNGEYVIDEIDLFNEDLDKLKKEYKEDIESMKKSMEEYNKMLDDEVEIDIFEISLEDISDEITVAQFDGILEIIKD